MLESLPPDRRREVCRLVGLGTMIAQVPILGFLTSANEVGGQSPRAAWWSLAYVGNGLWILFLPIALLVLVNTRRTRGDA